MVKISTVIQIIFAETFESQEFTIRAAPGLSGPTNTCDGVGPIDNRPSTDKLHHFVQKKLIKKDM